MKKLYNSFIFDIIVAVIALALGIVMLPPFGIGNKVLNILLAITLVAYLIIYLFDKAKRAKGVLFILTVVEMVIICFVIVGLVVDQFSSIIISGVCRTIGLVVWLRGSVVSIGSYLSSPTQRRYKRSLVKFLLGLLSISAGAFLMGYPLISNMALTWIICIFFFICALIFGFLALLYSPSKRTAKESKSKEIAPKESK